MTGKSSAKGILDRWLTRYRGWEYWNTFLFEAPAHLRLAFGLMRRRLGARELCKANWSLDHGGFAFASKFEIQQLFPAANFPATTLVDTGEPLSENLSRVATLQRRLSHQWPLILKPDNGRIGRGVVRVRDDAELHKVLKAVEGRYLVQEYCNLPFEAGVFFYRLAGKAQLFSVTLKEFPRVVGDGVLSIRDLLAADERLHRFIGVLSHQLDESRIPTQSEVVLLSYVGNHAQGAVFRTGEVGDQSSVLNRTVEILGDLPGFNYGRLDVRAATPESFWAGDFIALEVNGVDSLATNIFDPSWSLLDAYRQLFRQYDLLLAVADEQRGHAMELLPWRELYRKTRDSEALLLRNHEKILTLSLR
jgi:hypothetical protein